MANTKPFSTWSSTGICSLFAIFICNLTHIANNPLPLSHLYLSIHFIETAYQPILCSTTLTITSFNHHRLPKFAVEPFPTSISSSQTTNKRRHRQTHVHTVDHCPSALTVLYSTLMHRQLSSAQQQLPSFSLWLLLHTHTHSPNAPVDVQRVVVD